MSKMDDKILNISNMIQKFDRDLHVFIFDDDSKSIDSFKTIFNTRDRLNKEIGILDISSLNWNVEQKYVELEFEKKSENGHR
jgi:hypothetical protein